MNRITFRPSLVSRQNSANSDRKRSRREHLAEPRVYHHLGRTQEEIEWLRKDKEACSFVPSVNSKKNENVESKHLTLALQSKKKMDNTLHYRFNSSFAELPKFKAEVVQQPKKKTVKKKKKKKTDLVTEVSHLISKHALSSAKSQRLLQKIKQEL